MAAHPEDLRVLTWLLRAVRNCPQMEMGAAARVDPSAISRYESGHMVPPRANLERLAAAAGVPISLLDTVLLPALRATRLARALSPPYGHISPTIEEAAEALACAVKESFSAAAASLLVELDAAARLEEQAAAPIVEERNRQADLAAVKRLCSESEQAATDDGPRALELATLALRISEVSPGDASWRASLRSYALPYVDNARRAASDKEPEGSRRPRPRPKPRSN